MQTHRGVYCRGYLPHIDIPDTIQTICYHQEGSFPVEIQRMLRARSKQERQQVADEALDRMSLHAPFQEYEADIVEASLQYFDGVRYDLIAWVVMPNHVHVCMQQKAGWALAKIVQSWKRHSSREINRRKGRTGQTWERDFFDKAVRTEDQLKRTIAYIEENPVKAGLVPSPTDWRWSSAWNNRTKWPGVNTRLPG